MLDNWEQQLNNIQSKYRETLIAEIDNHQQNGDYEQAISSCDKLIHLGIYNLEAWQLKAKILLEFHELHQAYTCFEMISFLEPSSHLAWTQKGIILYYLGEENNALKALDKALEINPFYVEALMYKADSFFRLDNLDESTRIFKEILEIDENCHYSHHRLGDINYALNEYDEAAIYYELAFDIAQEKSINFPFALKGLADSYFELKKYCLSVHYYNEYLKSLKISNLF